jgi:hypothetical protein
VGGSRKGAEGPAGAALLEGARAMTGHDGRSRSPVWPRHRKQQNRRGGANDTTAPTSELPRPFRRDPRRAPRPSQRAGPRLRPLCALLHVLKGLGRRSTDCRRARPCGHRATAFRLHRTRFERGQVLGDRLLVERGRPRFCGGLHAPTLRGALRTYRTLSRRGCCTVGVKAGSGDPCCRDDRGPPQTPATC